ncbi:cation transport protein-domain-containing protein [Syncephalastrum racemosum]|uniref:Cation transport protein-domain-containing protein n=1 Tax=Syncephalastrum racemosum TaxID=13706 RepID=A0A1X2HN46_SYNRA|nr:cation transport protein-domain-containing protein [Syncephalastrum racemosum]
MTGQGRTDFTDANTVSGTQGIAFAGNIEQQREMARQRLEKDRRFEELMQKIARENKSGGSLPDVFLDSDDSEDEDDIESIMRQPIDKSQLTRQQRYRIGGAEYRAIDMLTRIVPIYYLGLVCVASFLFRIYVATSTYAQEVLLTSNPKPVDPWFFSFFMGLSTFNNLGLNQLDASVVPFQNAPFPLLLSAIMILIGNTMYAVCLRFVIWILWRLTPESHLMQRETFRYLLDHPRRCYTSLFPSTQTWWLFFIGVALTVTELVCFIAFNYWLPVINDLSWGSRVLDGFFQSVATRNGTQIVYIIAMYISVYPVAISMRNSNVYQERALGIFRGDDDTEEIQFTESDLRGPAPFMKLTRHPTVTSVMTHSKKLVRGPDFFVLTQIQRQLTRDICWLISCVFLICVLEWQAIMSPSAITQASVIYECVSAFGNVGASTGYPNTATSQAAQYRLPSKLVLILLMYRGRLPSAIDRAVLLPSEQLEQQEVEDQMLKRRNTSFTHAGSVFSSSQNPTFYTRSSTL